MYNKEGKLKFETSAEYVPIGNTGISFYDSDIGTADLIFYITRNQRPLEISDENVDCFLILKASDGTYIVDKANIVDPLNGKARYTVPKEFLKHTGKVQGQVYIAVHGKEDMITEVEFNFNIKESLISTIPAVDKLNYIKTFDDLRTRIEERIEYIENALANGDDYVTQMDETFKSGMKSLNDRSAQVIGEIQALVDGYKQELATMKDNTLTEMNDKYITSITDMNNVRDEIVDITDSLVTKDVLNEEIDEVFSGKTYQEYSFTDVEGKRTYLGTLGTTESGYASILDLPPGLYEATIPGDAWTVDAPQSTSGSAHIASIDVIAGSNKRKQIRLIQNLSNFEFRATVHTENVDNPNGRFMGWKRVMDAQEFESKNSDSGWIRWETKNSTTERELNIPTAIQNQYRVIMTNGVKRAHLRINVNNIESKMVIGSIPKEYVPKVHDFYLRTPVTMNPAVVQIDVDGQIWVYLNTNDVPKWQPGHYIKGEVSWIIDDVGAGI